MSDDKAPGPFSIGSVVWPGTSRVVEEGGELMQVLGKLIGAGGAVEHWDGSNLRFRLAEEVADLGAALLFFAEHNGLDLEVIDSRSQTKYEQYQRWHTEGLAAGEAS